METFGTRIGRNASSYAEEYDEKRIAHAERSTSEEWKKARVSLRSQKLDKHDAYEVTEMLLYGPGIAD
ncbi:hypothetical protein PV327_007456 [Microctonus hyperodae]|uniref:Uncharacterized protein n=1 Tax=Microctonus hyperodae TaxID=165561 RepID=A0AA39FZG6_MICHY|nr:hypothetical protein PV327_007456 [Microctonus hyperodae]